MRKWGFGEWFAGLLFTWWIPFSIYGYFTRGDDRAKQERFIPEPTQEERNRVYTDLCAQARWKAQQPGLSPSDVEHLTKVADAVCKLTLPLIKEPARPAR